VPADNTHLLPVREMEATEQVIEARNKGDKDLIERAEKNLAAIRQARMDLAGKAGIRLTNP
jgi:phosphonate transport system substrate-binding protein